MALTMNPPDTAKRTTVRLPAHRLHRTTPATESDRFEPVSRPEYRATVTENEPCQCVLASDTGSTHHAQFHRGGASCAHQQHPGIARVSALLYLQEYSIVRRKAETGSQSKAGKDWMNSVPLRLLVHDVFSV